MFVICNLAQQWVRAQQVMDCDFFYRPVDIYAFYALMSRLSAFYFFCLGLIKEILQTQNTFCLWLLLCQHYFRLNVFVAIQNISVKLAFYYTAEAVSHMFTLPL